MEQALNVLRLAEQFPTLPRYPDRVAQVSKDKVAAELEVFVNQLAGLICLQLRNLVQIHFAYGRCYGRRVDGDTSENLENMIRHCNLALNYFKRNDHS